MTVQEPLASAMESLCSCPVCYSNFNETTRIAQMLHCGHTFCSQCVENVQKYGNCAYLECPSCRAETKCDAEKVGINFLVMEMIQKIGLMGPNEIAPPKEPKRARKEQRERTIDEMIDESYRQLIADIKSELMVKFEELRDGLRKSTIQSVHSELEDLSERVLGAVRDAYDGLTDSENDDDQEDEEEQEEDKSIQLESARDSDGESVMSIERNTPSPTSSVIIVENPMRSSEDSNSSDASSSSSSSSASTSSGDESDDEENDGMDGMESESSEWPSDDEEEDDDDV
ncbi:unnamed protein product [Caenorhabditis nigoni]